MSNFSTVYSEYYYYCRISKVEEARRKFICCNSILRDESNGTPLAICLLEDKYKDKNIVFVGISCDQSERRWRNELGFQREVVAYQWWIGGDESFMRAFQIVAIPRLILLDKEGRVLNLSLPKPSDRKFEKILSKLKDL